MEQPERDTGRKPALRTRNLRHDHRSTDSPFAGLGLDAGLLVGDVSRSRRANACCGNYTAQLGEENVMRKSLIGGVVVALLATVVLVAQEKDKEEKEPSFWMKQKLKYSQEILNGLAKEDYELISKNAMAMKGLNKIEYFVRQRPPQYRTQLKSFQHFVDELVTSAEDENLDGATLAFTQMTISCVKCHKELRKK
jgi:hypothetical protein